MFMGQWKCVSWNIHHTVSISLKNTTFIPTWHFLFNILIFFSNVQYISVLSFSMWPFFYKILAGVSDFLTDKAIILKFHNIYDSGVYINIFYLTNPWNSMGKKFVTQNVLHSWHFWQHISMTIFSRKRYFNDILWAWTYNNNNTLLLSVIRYKKTRSTAMER